MALSRESPRVGVTHHLALWSPDLPRRLREETTRSPGQPIRMARIGDDPFGRTLADVLPTGYGIRPLAVEDAPALAAAYSRNRAHLAPWDPRRTEEFFTEAGQRKDAEAKLESAGLGLQDPWLLVHCDEVVGRVNLNNLVRGVFQNASLGYWVDRQHTGRGLGTAAVGFALRRAVELGLHRVEAGTLVGNVASQAVLRRCGFEQYGEAANYLFIAGAWQDHLLFQRILHDRPAGAAAP